MESLQRVDDDDSPNRCQRVTAMGQCRAVALEQGGFCTIHAVHAEKKQQKEAIRNYNLTKFRGRVDDFANSAKVKSLREEVGMLRVMLEEIWNRCQDSTELILMSGKISGLLNQAKTLVEACHKLEAATGMMLDKTAILQLATVIVDIICEHVKDDETIIAISDKVMIEIMKAQTIPE